MSAFYSTPNNDQSGTTVNLCPKIPGTVPLSESQFPSNMMYLSFSNSGSYADAFIGSTRAHQNHLDIPGASTIISQGITGGSSDMLASRLSNHACNALKDGRNQMLYMQTLDGSMNGAGDLVCADGPQMNLQAQLGIVNGQSSSLPQASMHNQGLSLSFSSQMPLPSIQYQSAGSNLSFIGAHQSTSGNAGPSREDSFQSRTMSGNVSSNGHSNLTCLIPNSKYLRGMQELLDEVVNVSKTLKQKPEKSEGRHVSNTMIGKVGDGGLMADGTKSNPADTAENFSHELSTSERQDLQNKVRKLLGMLDEIDRRYKQYFHQMQIIVSCFDAVAGSGAAKPYTSLALQTISRHFRCLRDAIAGQIQATKRSLGEPDNSCTRSGLSRLRVIDQQLRQQCGVIQQHPWRPQRGLPESSVSILRAWLFEHFLHPYPKDSEKLVLARQTGLTRSQVSNWFINARVRLWKPMIEDMYKEEFGDIEIDSNSSSENPRILKEDIQSSEEREELQNPAHARHQASQISDSPRPSLVSTVDVAESIAPYQNESTTQDSYMNLKINDQRPIVEYSSFFQDALAHPERVGRFFAYQMTEIGQCGRDGVSLTLGLQQCDSGLPVSDNQQSFLTMSGNEVYGSAAPASADATDYDYANAGDQQLRNSSTQLLHDFVT